MTTANGPRNGVDQARQPANPSCDAAQVPFAFEEEQRKKLDNCRGGVFSLIFGAAAVLIWLNLAGTTDAWAMIAAQAAMGLLALAVALTPRLALGRRAVLGLACFYAVACWQLWDDGLAGSGTVWLLAAPLVAAMFLGLGGALAALALNAAVLGALIFFPDQWPALHGLFQGPFWGQHLRAIGQAFLLAAVMAVGLASLMQNRDRIIVDQHATITDLLNDRQSLQKAQLQLRQSELRFRMLAENAVDIIWSMDLDLHYTYISPSVLGITGYSPAEMISRPLEKQTTPEAHAQAMEVMDQAMNQGRRTGQWRQVRHFDLPLRHKDGSTIWLSVSAAFVLSEDGRPLGLHGMSRDITQRKRALEELKRKSDELAKAYDELHGTRQLIQNSRNKLKAIFDGLQDPIISLTPGGEIESLNLAAASMIRRHPRELVGLSGLEFLNMTSLPPQMVETIVQAFKTMVNSRRGQWRLVEAPGRGDDGPRFLELNLTPVTDESGQLVLGIIHFDDVTEIKRMEIQIRKYNDELEQMVAERTQELTQAHGQLKQERDRLAQANSELRRLDQLRHDLTNMVVHDMKGPLAELMGNLDLLHYDLDKAQRAETLDMAEMGGRDLLRMIMNLLDIGRLEEDRLRAHCQPLEFGQLARRVRDKFTTMIRLKGLDVGVEDNTTGPVHADPDLLERVLQNLLTNALQYTDQGSIVMAADVQNDGHCLISVRDTGSGIPAAAHDIIFKKFVQASEDGGPRTSTGLGLTFCKLAVEAHGGEIWFESKEGRGTTFFVRLPGQTAEARA